MIARRESIKSSSSEEIHEAEDQARADDRGRRPNNSCQGLIDDDPAKLRARLDDPEDEFLLRIEERHGNAVDQHAILQCVLGDLKSFSDLNLFLEFEKKLTTAPEKLTNPTGHYRQTVKKFYEVRSKKRHWDHQQQLRTSEAKLSARSSLERPGEQTCSLHRCHGIGEIWDAAGLVHACGCEIGQTLAPTVIAAFKQMNSSRVQRGLSPQSEQADSSVGERN